MIRCAEPEWQMEILEAARAGRALETSLARHAEGCASCRLSLERLRRMVAVWQRDREDELASERAAALCAARLARRRTPLPRDRGAMSFAAIGAVAGVSLFLAMRWSSPPAPSPTAPSGAPRRAPVAQTGEPPPTLGAPAASVTTVPHIEGPHGVVKLAEGVRVELAAGESARVTLAGGATSVLRGPCRVEFWSSASEVGGWRMAFLPAASEAASVPAPADEQPRAREAKPIAQHPKPVHPHEAANVAPPEPDRAWQRASEALRRDDFGAADHALADLEKAADPATRDAARLTRAQLAMAHGQGESVRAVLLDLRSNGATALVRERAAECLTRLDH